MADLPPHDDLSGSPCPHSGPANLQSAVLSGANLQSALLFDASLQGALFSDVNLQEADLSRANLQGADLSRARNLTPEQIADAEVDEAT